MTVSSPLLWFSAAFVAGMYLFALFGATVAYTVIFCICIAAVIKGCRKRKIYDNTILVFCVVLFTLGTIRFGLYDDITNNKLFLYQNKTVTLKGNVLEDATTGDRNIHLEMNVNAITDEIGTKNDIAEKVTLICFIDEKSPARIPIPKRGDIISVTAELSIPKGAQNTGGFDYRTYLKTKEIFFQATGDAKTLSVIGQKPQGMTERIFTLRAHFENLMNRTFPSQEAGVLKAYVLGDSSSIDEHTSNIFSASGLSHILAISGAHVAVFLSLIVGVLVRIRIAKWWQRIISAILVIFFVIFTGMSVSAIRAGFACVLTLIAKLFFRRSHPITALFEIAAILSFIQPFVILSASFMLSFAATYGILLFGNAISDRFSFIYDNIEKGTHKKRFVKNVCDVIIIGASSQLLTIPVLIYLFQSFSTMSVIATLFITPILAPLLAGGLLFCAVGSFSNILAVPIAGFIYFLTKCMIFIAEIFSNIPISKVSAGGITPFYLLCYAVALFLFYAIIKRKHMTSVVSLSSLAALSVVFVCHAVITYPITEVSFVNVGQGDCTLIQAPGNCDILIDAGGKEGDYSIAEETVLPYLIQKGVYDIEYVVISHGHTDHINGVIGLMELTKIKHIIVPKGFGGTDAAKILLDKAQKSDIPVTYMAHGDEMLFENGLKFSAIMPDEKILAFTSYENANKRSLLFKVQYGNSSFLFTGDISAEEEGYAVRKYADMLDADVLKAAHHGSKYSNSELFLQTVSPVYTYIPVGKNNYGHSGTEVLERFSENDIFYYRADQENDVTFYLDTTCIRGIRYNERNTVGG